MPTGYTYPVAEGKISTFRDFALQCARGMGFAVTLRAAPADQPIPEVLPKTDIGYHDRKITESLVTLDRLRAMSPADAEREAAAAFDKALGDWERRTEVTRQRVARLQRMLEMAREWCPPSPEHVEFKSFMIEQLEAGIRHDNIRWPKPVRVGAAGWLATTIKNNERSVAYHSKERDLAQSRDRDRQAYWDGLRASLDQQADTESAA